MTRTIQKREHEPFCTMKWRASGTSGGHVRRLIMISSHTFDRFENNLHSSNQNLHAKPWTVFAARRTPRRSEVALDLTMEALPWSPDSESDVDSDAGPQNLWASSQSFVVPKQILQSLGLTSINLPEHIDYVGRLDTIWNRMSHLYLGSVLRSTLKSSHARIIWLLRNTWALLHNYCLTAW